MTDNEQALIDPEVEANDRENEAVLDRALAAARVAIAATGYGEDYVEEMWPDLAAKVFTALLTPSWSMPGRSPAGALALIEQANTLPRSTPERLPPDALALIEQANMRLDERLAGYELQLVEVEYEE